MRSGVLIVAFIFVSDAFFAGAAWSQEATNAVPLATKANSKTETQPTEDYLLPNGWRVSPAGRQCLLTDLPLSIVTSPDGRYAFVATSGYNAHELAVIDLSTGNRIASQTVRQSWFGLAADFKQGKLWWSGGGNGNLHQFSWKGSTLEALTKHDPIEENTSTSKPAEQKLATPPDFRSGIYLDFNSASIYSLANRPKTESNRVDYKVSGTITQFSLKDGAIVKSASCGRRPYDVLKGRNGLLYVSDWADRRVLVLDPESLHTIAKIPVGEHPNQLALHPTDDRLFVTCASSNGVWVIDTGLGTVEETIFTPLFPKSPEGSTPDALCVSSDGETLYVANADNNCVAVIDIENRRRSQVRGFIPTGWYPTSVAVTPDGKQLLVGVGKGNITGSNKPERSTLETALEAPVKEGGYRRLPFPHVGTTLSGALSIIDVPDEDQLKKHTDQVYRNCPYSDKLLSVAPYSRPTAIPVKVGDPSPIKYIIYIIKENRTYDQVFSDIQRGNGDRSLLMFGEEITPNHHKLANEFVLLDNLYCNGHVSVDGHPWSTMAYNTDYIARNWALTYSKRLGIDDDDDADLSNAPSGYLWDACKRQGISYRSYGEYGDRVSQSDGTFRIDGRVPGLIGHMSPKFGLPLPSGEKARDTDRLEVFLEEFREYEKNGNLPRFIVMSLGEDHTQGTRPGVPTPQASVASNDLALGKLVEAVSHSKYWPQMAIFVIEDDAQNGPDHVDAHRTVGLVVSPYIRRNLLDSTQYSTCSMIRTMELIFGLPPLSQFDAAATPMFESFTDKPNLTPYNHEGARIDLSVRNTIASYGADRSNKMDFSEYDRIDDFELNEILWRAIKGRDAPVPPAVRRAIAYRGLEIPTESK